MKITRTLGQQKWLGTVVPSTFLTIVAVITVWPLTRVQLDRHDHPIHLLKAWQFFNEMLIHGRLSGYNNNYSLGYPVNDITPCGGEMWVALFRIATFGRFDWAQTYKLAMGGLIVFIGLSTFAFARRYFGVIAGTLAGLFAILDPGGLYQGGWEWASNFGVWPVSLACCCAMMAFAKLEDTATSPQTSHVIAAGLWIAAALWVHPLSLMLFALAFPLQLADTWSRGSLPITRTWFRITAGYGIGFGLSSFSLLPMLARSHYTFDRGALGETVEKMAEKLVEFRTFDGMWVFIAALGVVGGIRVLMSKRRGALLLVGAFGLCLLMATDVFVNKLHVERIYPGFVKLEATRMLMGCKVFGFPLAAYGAVSMFGIGEFARISHRRWFFRLALAVAILLPFASPVSRVIYDRYARKTYNTEFPASDVEDNDKVNRWALSQRNQNSDFYRIAYSMPSRDLLECKNPMVTRTPMYLDMGTPATQFSVFPDDVDPEMLEMLSVKFLVTDGERTDSNFVLEKTFGKLKVYRFTRYNKNRFSFVGNGHGELLEFEPDLVRVRVTDAESNTKLKLHLAAYDRWEASQNGQRLPIRVATVTAREYPVLMEVPVSNGDVEFRFVRRAVDWLGLGLTLLTAALVVRYGWLQGRYPVRFNALRFVEERKAILGWSILIVAAVGCIGAASRASTKKHMLPKDSLFQRVEGHQITAGGHPCSKVEPLDFVCAGQPLQAQYTTGTWGSHLCMATDYRQPLTLITDTTLGSALQVFTDTFADDGSIHLTVNGRDLGTEATRRAHTDWRIFQFDTRAFAGQTANVRLELSGAALRCFDVRLVH